MTPRQPLTSVGYAFRAKEADSVKDGAASTQVIANDAITTDKIADDAISGDKIAPATITSSNIANGAVGSSQISDGSIATQDLTDDAVTVDKISPTIISSIDGVTNDGGNVDLIEGPNVTITPDDSANTITIASTWAGQSIWSESGGNVYRSLGNVGIGTTNPQAKLSFGADPFTPRKIALWDEVNNFYGLGIFPGQLTFLTNDTGKMSILDNGNVGIGTSFPNSKLTVEGKSGDYTLININQQGAPMWAGLRLDRSGTEKWFIGMSQVNDNLIFRRSASSDDMVIDYSGNVGFAGDVGIYGNLTVFGFKGFAQPHPDDPSKQIVYVCLEGGESGVYVRGTSELKNGRIEIDLPEHFSLVAGEDSLTVQVTPLGDCPGLFVQEKTPNRIIIRESQGGKSSIRFDYLVMGIRRGFENHKVIQEKAQHQAKYRHD
ncbi:MAG: hypothetical protein U9R17_04610 [Thermodesulfobacteriota bacterium]|nr:hypothetical protein [Thermodesulfobacteriota bacterium]